MIEEESVHKQGERVNWLMQLDSGFGGVKTRSEFLDNTVLSNWYLSAMTVIHGEDDIFIEANKSMLKDWGLKAEDIMEFYNSLEDDINSQIDQPS